MNVTIQRRSPKSLPSNVEVVPVNMAELDAAWQALSTKYLKDPAAEGWITPEEYAKRFGMSAVGARMFLSRLADEGKVSKLIANYQGRRRSFYRPILGARR